MSETKGGSKSNPKGSKRDGILSFDIGCILQCTTCPTLSDSYSDEKRNIIVFTNNTVASKLSVFVLHKHFQMTIPQPI